MFKHKYPKLWCPSKSAVYRHLWRYKGTLKRFWFSRLYKKLKVKQARKNFAKKRYNPFSSLPDINSSELGHFQADSIIGKATDKKAIASLIELNSGLVWLNLYNRKAHEFAAKTSSEIKKHKKFKTILVDNGSEKSKLDILLDEKKYIVVTHILLDKEPK